MRRFKLAILMCWTSSFSLTEKFQFMILHNLHCYIAENFFSTARSVIGYFEVTWHLTMKLFPAKICEEDFRGDRWKLWKESEGDLSNLLGKWRHGRGHRESHQKLLWGITSVKLHSKGGSAKFHLVYPQIAPPPPPPHNDRSLTVSLVTSH